MNDRELDAAVAASVVSDAEVAALDLAGTDLDLCEAIMSTQSPYRTDHAAGRHADDHWGAGSGVSAGSGGAPHRWPVRALAVAAALAVLATLAALPVLSQRGSSAWAAEALEVAEGAPRYLLEADGWSVTRADGFAADAGEMTFTDGSEELDLHWRPGQLHQGYVEDRAASAAELDGVTVAGEQARVFQYDQTTDFTALWRHGEHSMEARGVFPDAAAFAAALATLREVDVDSWLSALPADVVRPDAQSGTVDEMIADIPLPPGFDPSGLGNGEVRDRYQLGAEVTSAVSCGWMDLWAEATDAGDAEGVQAAVTAMAGSRDWAILQEMDAEGDLPEVIWEYADAMAGDGTFYGEPLGEVYGGFCDHLG